MPWVLPLRKPVTIVKKLHHFTLVELRNGCQSKYICIKNKSDLHGISKANECARSLSARQSQDVDLDYIKIFLPCENEEPL